MPRHINHIVDPALDPDIPVPVPLRAVPGVEHAGVRTHIRVQVPFMVLPDRARDGRPRPLEHEHALDVVPRELLPADGVQYRRLDPKERHRRRAGLGLDRTRERGDDDRARLGLPERVDDGALPPADVLVVPVPGLGVDRLAYAAEDAEGRQVVAFDVVLAQPAEEPYRGGGRVELRQAVLLDGFPVAGGRGVHGCALEYGGGYAVAERAVHDVGVPCDPPDIGHAREFVVRVDVENVLDGERGAEEVSTCGVHDALGFSGRSGCVKDEQRVFGRHDGGRTIRWYFGGFFVPPEISSLDPRNGVSSPAEDEDVFDYRTLFECGVDDGFGSDRLASASSLVGGDQHARAAVVDAVSEGL